MSDTDAPKPKANTGWTDRERLAYLVSLVEHADAMPNFKTAPLPAGRTLIACERMLTRLKTTLAAELSALRAGVPVPVPVPEPVSSDVRAKKGTAASPRKRKAAQAEGSPVKKDRGAEEGAADGEAGARVKEEEEEEEEEEDMV